MSAARTSLFGLVSLSLLTSLHALAAEPSDPRQALSLWLDACLAQHRASIEQVLSLELRRPVSAPLNSPLGLAEKVAIECSAATLTLTYVSDITQRKRSLDARSISDKALARTVALAVVELIEAPESTQPRTAEPVSPTHVREVAKVGHARLRRSVHSPTVRLEVPTPSTRSTTIARASLLGTARIFPATSDLTLGVRLRSRFVARQRSALLLGFGGESGSAARPPGNVSVAAAYAELGFGYDVWRPGVFTLAVEALGEAGYVVLKGQPRAVADIDGEQLRGAWSDLQLSIAPRFRLVAGLDLTSRAGLGIMLLTPSATFDSKQLNVWHGVSASVDLGLALSL